MFGFVLPPWQLATSYAHHIGKGPGPRRVGGLWILAKNGNILEWDWLEWPMKMEQQWKPTN